MKPSKEINSIEKHMKLLRKHVHEWKDSLKDEMHSIQSLKLDQAKQQSNLKENSAVNRAAVLAFHAQQLADLRTVFSENRQTMKILQKQETADLENELNRNPEY